MYGYSYNSWLVYRWGYFSLADYPYAHFLYPFFFCLTRRFKKIRLYCLRPYAVVVNVPNVLIEHTVDFLFRICTFYKISC